MGWITRVWSGEEELWKVLLIYGAFFIFLAKVAGVALRLTTSIDFDNPTPVELNSLNCLKVAYGIWFVVSAWRSAFNTVWKFWGYIVRGIIILYVVIFCVAYYQIHAIVDPFELINRGVDSVRQWADVKYGE